jgi:hypothetical protein
MEYVLTVLVMFISGNHVEKSYTYPDSATCQREGATAVELIRKAYNSPDIDVRALCNGEEV